MNDLERFKAVAHFETPDYTPIFGFLGAPGMSGGCMATTHERLVATGMPASVGGCRRLGQPMADLESWRRYWGATGPITCSVRNHEPARGFQATTRVEGEYEIIESESGAVTRQVIDNDITYIMPEYIAHPVRDRDSWEFYKERMTPTVARPADEVEAGCRLLADRQRPLAVNAGGAYGFLRSLMGPEAVSMAFYDDPELIHDMMRWRTEHARRWAFPLMERLRPEVVQMGEDLCYNHGMLLSPALFDEFCGEHYRVVCEAARVCGADLVAIDTDGNAMEFAEIAAGYGVNAIYPCEVKAGNDLFALRERLPEMVFFGWLEKECVNEGNEDAIRPEIMGKVPPLLKKGGYFPNGDHGIQPLVTFPNMCKFMTLLHEVCDNPEGEFPRV